MKKKRRRKIPKLRIPIPPPGHSWSKKDYNRKEGKKIPSYSFFIYL